MNEYRYKIIACAAVLDELNLSDSSVIDIQELDAGLHLSSEKLHQALQNSINQSSHLYNYIILGFGLCAMALIGIQARECPILIPRVDDCIGLFLGSQEYYNSLRKENPGTYYLNQSWIDRKITVFNDYKRLSSNYGEEQAKRMIKLILKGYSRLVYITSHRPPQDNYQNFARKMAQIYGLEYKEIQGSSVFLNKIIHGPYDNVFIRINPGTTLDYLDLKKKPEGQGAHYLQSSPEGKNQ